MQYGVFLIRLLVPPLLYRIKHIEDSLRGDLKTRLCSININGWIFNILFVIGISSTVNPLVSGEQIVVDLIVMMSITLLLFGFALTKKLNRTMGFIFLALYIGYLTYLILRTLGIINI